MDFQPLSVVNNNKVFLILVDKRLTMLSLQIHASWWYQDKILKRLILNDINWFWIANPYLIKIWVLISNSVYVFLCLKLVEKYYELNSDHGIMTPQFIYYGWWVWTMIVNDQWSWLDAMNIDRLTIIWSLIILIHAWMFCFCFSSMIGYWSYMMICWS